MPDLYSKMMTAENEFKTSATSQRLRFLCCPTVTLFVSSAYPRAGFRIPRTDKNSGKSLIKLENSSTANASVNQNT